MNAFAVVSDSGTLPEESSFFTSVGHPFPAICIRTSTERPEAIDKGDFIIAGIDEKSLLQAVDIAVELCRDGQHGIPVPDYVDENVSIKVVKIVQSYVGIVNKMVWRKFWKISIIWTEIGWMDVPNRLQFILSMSNELYYDEYESIQLLMQQLYKTRDPYE